MKPIRIFLIRTLTTALFMAAYYKQEKMRNQNFRDICIIYWEGADEWKGKKEEVFFEACRRISSLISSEIIILPETYCGYSRMHINNMLADRSRKNDFLKKILHEFSKNNIYLDSIKEVYHGNFTLHQYIKYLNPHVKLFGFEHGIHEVYSYLSYNDFKFRLKHRIKTIVGRLFFLFFAYAQNYDVFVSVFAPRLERKANKKNYLKEIQFRYIQEVANEIICDGFRDRSFMDNNNCIGIVLMSDGYCFDNIREDYIKFHRDLANYLHSEIMKITPQINTIIFKPKFHDSYFSEIKQDLIRIFQGYRVFFFDEIAKANYPIESYLDAIQPAAMFGDISSGLFFSKELMPKIQTYTFHEYTMQYQLRHFGEISIDFGWLIDGFYKKYAHVFNDIAPKIMKFG